MQTEGCILHTCTPKDCDYHHDAFMLNSKYKMEKWILLAQGISLDPLCSSLDHWRSWALETKLSPELPIAINQKSQNLWTTQMRVWPRAQEPHNISKGRWMCLFIQVWYQPFPGWLLIPPFTSAFPTLSYWLLLFPWLLDPNVSIGLFPFYHRLHLHVSATFTGSLREETMSPQTSYSYFQCCLGKTNSRTGRE